MVATLAQAAAAFLHAAAMMPVAEAKALEEGCRMIEAEAKDVIGTYRYGWSPLKPATVARKAAGDTPLLETGEMRGSIEHQVIGHTGHVGSNNMKAVWQELGTSRGIPPRSFLMGAAMRKHHEIGEMAGRYVFAALNAGLGLSYLHWAGVPGAPLSGGAAVLAKKVSNAPPLDLAIGRVLGRLPR